MPANKMMTECQTRMNKAIDSTKNHFASIRAGRANVSMLDGIKVSQYGSDMPLNQVGSVSAPEARLLVIDPWDKSVIPAIEKAIQISNLGLVPNNDGKVIRLQIPELTAERRKEYVKLAKGEAENGRIAVRNVRKDGDITQDELKDYETRVQKLTDDHIKKIDDLYKAKEKEITTV